MQQFSPAHAINTNLMLRTHEEVAVIARIARVPLLAGFRGQSHKSSCQLNLQRINFDYSLPKLHAGKPLGPYDPPHH